MSDLPAERIPPLLEAVVAVGSEHSLDSVLDQILRSARSLVGCRYAALGIGDDEGRLEQFLYVGVDDATVDAIGHPPVGEGLLGELLRVDEPIRVEAIADHRMSSGFPPGHPPMRSFLGVPIRLGGRMYGSIYLTEKDGGPFTSDDETVLVALAAVAGVAVGHAALHGETRRRASWAEGLRRIGQAVIQGESRATVDAELTLVARELFAAADAEVTEVEPDATPHTMAAPVPAGTTVPVWLAVRRDVGEPAFAEDELEDLRRFGDEVAVLLEAEEGRRRHDRSRIVHERERIARDLHDTVIQRIYATGISLEVATQTGADDLHDRISAAIDQLDGIIAEIRSTIFALSTPHDTERSLRAEIEQVVRDSTAPLGFRPTLRVGGGLQTLDDPVVDDVVAVVRESLSNVARHARASAAIVTCAVRDDQFVVVVEDDGEGPGRRSPGGRGLDNLAARAHRWGGGFSMESRSRGGTVVEWRVPVGDRSGAATA